MNFNVCSIVGLRPCISVCFALHTEVMEKQENSRMGAMIILHSQNGVTCLPVTEFECVT
jgi:hypothetical protein